VYEIEFFTKDNGECDVLEWLAELKKQAKTDKDSGVQYRQINHCLEILKQMGTYAPQKFVKHIEDDIWELRPGNNRVMLFHFVEGRFVLLHHFRKETQKTPPQEIERAKRERNEYLRQKGGKR